MSDVENLRGWDFGVPSTSSRFERPSASVSQSSSVTPGGASFVRVMKPVEAALPRSAHFVADWHTGAAVDDWHPVPFDERIAADRYLEEVSSTGTTIPAQVFVVRRDDEEFGVLVDAGLLRREL